MYIYIYIYIYIYREREREIHIYIVCSKRWDAMYISCWKINRSQTHIHRQRTTPPTPTHTHDKNNTPNTQTNTPHKHLTTLEGGATCVFVFVTCVSSDLGLGLGLLEVPQVNLLGAVPALSWCGEVSLGAKHHHRPLRASPSNLESDQTGVSEKPRVNSYLLSKTYCYPKGGGSPAQKLPRR